MWMRPSRRDQYVSWTVGSRFLRGSEASEGVVTTPSSGGGYMGAR